MKALKGRVFHLIDDPYVVGDEKAFSYFEDGCVIIDGGKIVDVGSAKLLDGFSGEIISYSKDELILPGFIDSHLHFPQTQMIAAYGKQLIEWLNGYTFVTEQEFKNKAHADMVAKVFFKELIRCGVTTPVAYCSVHPESVDAYFEEASRYNLRALGGKVMMSRNAAEPLLFSPERSYKESQMLIDKWHEKGRNHYVVTPRFAICCPAEELELAAKLVKENDRMYMQTHLSENLNEIDFTMSLFPERKNYTDVYDYYGLLGERCLFGHGIHLADSELDRLADTGSVITHCPTSNEFLGSGLLSVEKAKAKGVHVGLASDVGAGTSFSPLQTLNEAYKVAQLQGQSMSAVKGFYLLTLGNAKALKLDDKIGSLKAGNEADLVVLTNNSTPLMKFRQGYSKNITEELFVHMTIGDDRSVKAVFSGGNKIYDSGEFSYVNA